MFSKSVQFATGSKTNMAFSSTISLVDLAGSEGVAKSDISGERLK